MSRPIPQGIEVLVLKAAVDPDFKQILLQRRTAAAEAIGLELTAGEAAMLAAVPTTQLEAVIARASVPQEHRRAFLGQAAAAMLAALTATRSALAEDLTHSFGVRPGQGQGLPFERGAFGPQKEKTVEERVMEVIANHAGVNVKSIKRNDKLAKYDLIGLLAQLKKHNPAGPVGLRERLEGEFGVKVSIQDYSRIDTIGEMIHYADKALKSTPTYTFPGAF